MTPAPRRIVAALIPVALALGTALGAATSSHRVAPASLPAMRGMPAGVDSGPSPDAQRVLQSIPDPLAPAERVPPSPAALAAARTADSLRAAAARADSARIAGLGDSLGIRAADSLRIAHGDTLAAAAAADTGVVDTARVPVPAAMPILGERAGVQAAVDSALAAARAPDTSATAARPSECWGVQIGAPTEAGKATALRDAAQSLLLVPMKIELAAGRHRVRTDRCLTAAAADSLRRRAVLSGFGGAFRFGGGK